MPGRPAHPSPTAWGDFGAAHFTEDKNNEGSVRFLPFALLAQDVKEKTGNIRSKFTVHTYMLGREGAGDPGPQWLKLSPDPLSCLLGD